MVSAHSVIVHVCHSLTANTHSQISAWYQFDIRTRLQRCQYQICISRNQTSLIERTLELINRSCTFPCLGYIQSV